MAKRKRASKRKAVAKRMSKSTSKSLLEIALLIISLFGILLAAYAVTLHFAPSSSAICNISASWNCDKVNKSPWSLFLGIPVSILGLLSYLIVFFAVLKRKTLQKTLSFTAKDFFGYLTFLTLVMFGFQFYLTGIELYVLHAFCVVCVISQFCTFLLAFLVGREMYHLR